MFQFRTSARSGAVPGLLITLGLVMAACTSGGDGATCPGTGGSATVADGDVALCSVDLEFDATTIEAPEGEEFTITYTNLESQPHNVAIYTEEGGEEIAIGEIITGPDATTQIVVPALDAGTYYFRCDVHPDMEGSIVIGG
jgi:plastocyanin